MAAEVTTSSVAILCKAIEATTNQDQSVTIKLYPKNPTNQVDLFNPVNIPEVITEVINPKPHNYRYRQFRQELRKLYLYLPFITDARCPTPMEFTATVQDARIKNLCLISRNA